MKNKTGSVLLGILLLLTGLLSIGVALSSTVLSSSIKVQRQYQKLSALALAEAGVNKGLFKVNIRDYYYGTGPNGVLESDISGGQYRVKIIPCTVGSTDCKYIESTGYLPTENNSKSQKTVRVRMNSVQNTTNLIFGFSAQSNANEIFMSNIAKINGSAYSAGPITMSNNSTITGNATSYGNSPSTSKITGGNGATIGMNAEAYTISGDSNFVKGTSTIGVYPLAKNPPISPADLNNTIDSWEASAEAAEVYPVTGRANKTISGINQTLGPIKINGDLIITNGSELKLLGNVWVNGNITVSNNARIYLDSATFGNNSGVMIADYKSDRSDSTMGKISLANNVTICGTNKTTPMTSTYTLMFSTQSPPLPVQPSNWKTYPAISVANNVHGGIYYAPFGSYKQSNVAQIKAVVANGIVLDNGAQLSYSGDLGNSGISGGPAGEWTITEWVITE